jgi:hypothetical protein
MHALAGHAWRAIIAIAVRCQLDHDIRDAVVVTRRHLLGHDTHVTELLLGLDLCSTHLFAAEFMLGHDVHAFAVVHLLGRNVHATFILVNEFQSRHGACSLYVFIVLSVVLHFYLQHYQIVGVRCGSCV